MKARMCLAACWILCQIPGHGGEGTPNQAFPGAAREPVLEGIISLPGFKACLLNFSRLPRISSGLREGERDDKVEVVRISPAEGIVEVMANPGMHRLVLSLSNTPPVGISFERARLASVLRVYGELKGRSILHPRVDSTTLTLRSSAKTSAEAVEVLERAFKESGLAVVPDGAKFVQVVPQSQAASVALWSSPNQGASATSEEKGMVLSTGCMDFRNCEAAQVVRMYAELVGRELENADQAQAMAADVITFRSQTPLTKKEARHAMDTLLAWAGLELIEIGEKSLRVTRKPAQ